MDPISLGTVAAVGAGASAGGGILGAIGSIMGGKSKSSMYQYQAGIADINARIAKQNADYQRSVGEVEAQQSGLKTRAEIGATKATQGARGVDVATGSNLQVRESEGDIGRENQAIIRSNAAHRAYGSEVEALQDTAQGQMARFAGKTSETAGYIGAASSILGAASSVSSKWMQGNSVGLWNSGSGATTLDLMPSDI